jgi:hypothetical protein
MRKATGVLLLMAACGGDGDASWLPEANAEYETLVALGAYRQATAAELCPAGPTGEAVALRYGTARSVRRLAPQGAEVAVEGHPTYLLDGQPRIERGVLCRGLLEVRFVRQRGQWFLETLRVLRRDTPEAEQDP